MITLIIKPLPQMSPVCETRKVTVERLHSNVCNIALKQFK